MTFTSIDKERFEDALSRAEERRKPSGIGTLDEKLLHAAVKNYFAPEEFQEQKAGRFIADILTNERLIEVQTGSCFPLKKKLPVLLEEYPVTVVYPIMRCKRLYWIDPQSGALSEGRKSPKKGELFDILPELIYLDEYIDNINFRLSLFLYDGEEYRLQNGWGREGKRGSCRYERRPAEGVGIWTLEGSGDYRFLLPRDLPEEFSSSVFSKITRLRAKKLWAALKILTSRGVITREKKGRTYIYGAVKRGEV